MVLRKLLLIAFWATSTSYCADHGTFKTCAQVDFCGNLRNRPPTNDYSVDSNTITQHLDIPHLTATLVPNNGGPNLTLFLYGVENNIFRLKITERDSVRYELEDVLDGEPKLLGFDTIEIASNSATFTTNSDSNFATITFSPFSIAFSRNASTEIIFNADQLTLSTNNVNAPFSFGLTFTYAYQLYGLHEHCETLTLKNTAGTTSDPYRLRNLDVSYYDLESPMALYASIPVIYGHGPNGTAGVFLHNAAEQWIETSSTDAYFMVESGALDLFVLMGPTPQEFVRQYTSLTGTAKVPPFWSLGYHQSRYTYQSQDDLIDVISNFDNVSLQMDAIWLDIDYTDGYKYFTWDSEEFSDPVAMQDAINGTNRKLVVVVNPHVKVEEGYNVYDGGLSNDIFVKNPDGTVYEGPCWPGTSSYVDFLNPAARQYFAGMYSYDNFPGTTSTLAGIWNDMNEPSVFDTSTELTLPPNLIHYGNVSQRDVHNIYGFLHTMSTYQGLLDRDNNTRRPFVLTRSHFAGSQRYAAFWTGENQADWAYLAASIQQCLNANMLGMVFCGADVGGYFGNPSNELLERWYQGGAWLPFYRSHYSKDSYRREPYLLPEDTQNVIRTAIRTRYYHLPQWYTLFYEHSRFGDPVIRPLFYHYPDDEDVYDIDYEFMVGRHVLIRPITEPGVETVPMYFPGGEDEIWFSVVLSDVRRGVGLVNVTVNRDSIPVYYRYGGITVAKESNLASTVGSEDMAYIFYYSIDHTTQAHGTVYLDDGISFEYQNSLNYNYNSLTMDGDTIIIEPIDGEGDFPFTVLQFVRKDIDVMPRNGNAGRSRETIYTKIENGTLLKDLRINLKVKTVLRLR